jgi:magnesium transporter
MVSATFTGKIIEGFEGMLTAVVGLTAAIPMLMDTGGNAGSQVSTLIIRGMALGEVRARDWFRILFKELRVGLLCGAVLAIVNLLRMWLFSSADLKIYFVVSAALICTLVISKLFGCALPIIAKFLRIDPALMAGPMLTTFVDTLSLLIYFSLARAFLL